MTDWLSHEAPDELAGVFLLAAGVVTLVWGGTLIVSGWRHWRAARPRPVLPDGFDFWLGAFLIGSDAALYGILGLSLIRDPSHTEVWGVLASIFWGLLAIRAFVAWARERAA